MEQGATTMEGTTTGRRGKEETKERGSKDDGAGSKDDGLGFLVSRPRNLSMVPRRSIPFPVPITFPVVINPG